MTMMLQDDSPAATPVPGADRHASRRAPQLHRQDYLGWAGALLALASVLLLHLLSALIAALLVHELVHAIADRLKLTALSNSAAKRTAAILIAGVVIILLALGVISVATAVRHNGVGLPELFQKLAEIIDHSRDHLPQAVLEYLPTDADELRSSLVASLREHSASLQGAGEKVVRISLHILVGMVIGALLALRDPVPATQRRSVSAVVADHAARLASAFRRVFLAQVWIAMTNTGFSWLYLGVALPIAGIHLPLTKTMIAITFFAGLIPIVGNIVSNAIIVLVSLNESLTVAAISLAFLIAVHKGEYFLNARIVGSRIRARAWEILLAMLVMEAAFGPAGVIAAPIFYAFAKDDLARKGLV